MEEQKEKVVAAVVGAISTYLQDERAIFARLLSTGLQRSLNLWGLAGRQEIMHYRQLTQLRVLRYKPM